jgi:hypothetical protein
MVKSVVPVARLRVASQMKPYSRVKIGRRGDAARSIPTSYFRSAVTKPLLRSPNLLFASLTASGCSAAHMRSTTNVRISITARPKSKQDEAADLTSVHCHHTEHSG